MYYKSLYYVIFMFIFLVFGYIFLDSGFSTKTRVRVDYEDNSDVFYEVKYLDDKYTVKDDKYIANMVDYIDIRYNYENVLSEYISGYYRYNVEAYLTAYEDDITSSLWNKKYSLADEKTVVLDQNDINSIKIDDSIRVDFRNYKKEIEQFIDDSLIDVNAYLHIRINILEFLKFNGLDNEYADNKVITVNIPLTDDIFKISVNNLDDKDSYYQFSTKKAMNIVLLIIGAFCISVSLALLLLVIRQFKYIYGKQNEYNRELNKILSKYDDCIVRVKRFYVNKKYNMIYVYSFNELMDVSDRLGKMISFKEMKRNSESIFVIIDEDNAWIYKLIKE